MDVKRRAGLYGFEYRERDKRRRPEGQKRSWDIKQLWQRNHEIVNLAALGHKHKDIAKMLGVTPATVSATVNGDLGQMKLSEVRMERDLEVKKTMNKIKDLTERALEIYNIMLNDESGECTLKDKKAVADTVVLELSGLRVPTRVQSQSIHATLTNEELTELKRRGIAAARESGLLAEVTEAEVLEQRTRTIGAEGSQS